MFHAMCMQSTNAFEWSEIIYIVVGAIIGLVASISMLVIERTLDKKGKLQIFYKRSNQRGMNGRGWGVDKCMGDILAFTLPVRLELQNTSNMTRVIRDVSLLLYMDDLYVDKMHQMEKMYVTSRTGGEVTGEKEYKFGTDNGSYSFVLPPRSIQRQECEYCITISSKDKNSKQFNRVILRYYDECNSPHTFRFMEVSNCWEVAQNEIDDEWILLKDKVRMKP